MAPTQSDIDFMQQFGIDNDLTEKTMEILHTAEITSKVVVQTLTDSDISSFGLSVGQKNMLLRGVRSASDGLPNAAVQQVEDVTTKTLKDNASLTAALEALKSAHLADILELDGGSPGYITASKSTGKVFQIPDFVVDPVSNTRPSEREIAKGVVIKSAGKGKPAIEEVTEAQWISANMLILLELIDNMDLPTIKSYLRYTVKIGNYLQVCHVPSVMKLDDVHRSEIADGTASAWNALDSDQCFFLLKKKEDPEHQFSDKQQQRRPFVKKTNFDTSGSRICFDFNKPSGCQRGDSCVYSHVCQVSGCMGNHPKYQHSFPPRFRGRVDQA